MKKILVSAALIAAASASLGVAGSCACGATPIKIMALGDSITHGNNGFASYRYPLYYDLQGQGYDNFTFVGGQTSTEDDADLVNTLDPATNQLAYPRYNIDFPKANQGMSGYDSWYIAQNTPAYAAAVQPDIVLLMAGTNDMLDGQYPVSEMINSYETIAADLRAANKHVAIVLAELIPGSWCPPDKLAQLNAQILTLPALLSTPDSPFIVVNPYTNFNVSAYTFDGVHTNVAGGQFMANVWAPAVASLLGGAPSATSTVWNIASTDGLWSTAANWSVRSPHVPGDTATFAAPAGSVNQTIHLDTVRTAGYLVFGNSAGTLTAGWTLDNNHVPSNVLTLMSPPGQAVPSITVNALAAGSVANITAAIAGTQGLLKNGVGTLELSGANTYSGGTTVSGGTLIFTSTSARPPADKLTINKSASTGKGSTVVVQGDANNLNNYRAALAGSFLNNSWINAGLIVSTDAATATGQGIGYLTGASYNALNGATYGPSDVILKYTFFGDANLDGRITAADYAQIDAGFLLHQSPTWLTGDFNYDSAINYQDYALIDAGLLSDEGQSSPLAQFETAQHAAEFGQPYLSALQAQSAAIPEPASLILLMLGGGLISGKRRR